MADATKQDTEIEHPVVEVHRLLDKIDSEVKRELNDIKTRQVDTSELPTLCEVVLELLGWTNTAYMENTMGIHPSLLNKFVKLRGKVNLDDARILADRLRTFLRSQDYAFDATEYELGLHRPMFAAADEKWFREQAEKSRQSSAAPVLTVRAEAWVVIKSTPTIKAQIADLASLLESIVQHADQSNLPSDEQALTEMERAQLIAILETSLSILKSPMAEKGLLKKARALLKSGAEKTAEKKVQDGLGGLMDAAASSISNLIGSLFS